MLFYHIIGLVSFLFHNQILQLFLSLYIISHNHAFVNRFFEIYDNFMWFSANTPTYSNTKQQNANYKSNNKFQLKKERSFSVLSVKDKTLNLRSYLYR